MANVFFAFPNFADVDFYTPKIGGGSWLPSLPLSNLQDRLLSKVARSTDLELTSTRFHVDLGFFRDARCICIPKHAMGRYAKIRARAASMPSFIGVRLGAAASPSDTSITIKCPNGTATVREGDTFSLPGDTTVYTSLSADTTVSEGGGVAVINVSPAIASAHADDEALTANCGDYVTSQQLDTGWKKVFPPIYPGSYPTLPWGHPSVWDGKIPEEDRADYPSPWFHLSEQPVLARYWLVEIDDRLNKAGYVDVARLFIARGFQPPRNFEYGAQLLWQNETQEQKTLGGALFHDERTPRRMLTMRVPHLIEGIAMSGFLDMFRELGRSGQVFVAMNPDDTRDKNRKSFLATLSTDAGLDFAQPTLLSTTTMQFNEVIA